MTDETQPNQSETTNQSPETTQPQADSSTTTSATPSDSASTDLGTEAAAEGTTTDLGTEEAKTEEKEAPPAFFGAPKNEDGTPADYAAFTLPEGSAVNEELQTSFTALAKELGLNQAGAQKLVDYKTTLDQTTAKVWGEHLVALKAAAKADPDIGGAKYDLAVAAGRAAITKFGGTPAQQAELRSVMNHYGVGAHPAMIRFFANIGKGTGETTTPVNGGSGSSVEPPLHELMYGSAGAKT